jgi:hypothetical protein
MTGAEKIVPRRICHGHKRVWALGPAVINEFAVLMSEAEYFVLAAGMVAPAGIEPA